VNSAPDSVASDAARTQGVSHRWQWTALYASFGAAAMSTQTYLLREYMVALGGDETAVGLGLATWLVGIAVGAVCARMLALSRARFVAGAAVALLAPCGLLEMGVARLGRNYLHVPSGEFLSLWPSWLLALGIFALPGALVGTAFVALAVRVTQCGSKAGQAIGELYVFESLGSLAAGALTSLVLLPFTRPGTGFSLLLLASLLMLLPAARAGLVAGYRSVTVLAVAVLCLILTPLGQRLESATQRGRFASLLPSAALQDWTDTPYEHLDLSEGESHALFTSGTYASSFPDPFEDESRAHPLMLLNQQPRRLLVMGCFEPGMLRYVLQHPVQQLDWVTLDRPAYEFVARHLDSEVRAAFSDPRVHVSFQDPRGWLRKSNTLYDLVLMLDRDPSTLLLARNTTVEFTRLIASRLASSGTYVMRFASGPNVQTGHTALLGASLYRTLHDVFAFVRATPGPGGLLVAGNSSQSVALDSETLGRRWHERAIQSDVFAPELLPAVFPSERIATLQVELRQAATSASVSRDDKPAAFVHALTVRQQLAQSAWAGTLTTLTRHPGIISSLTLLPSIILLLGIRKAGARRGSTLAALHGTLVIGATGMAFSIMLFFSFQTHVGALYSELGLLSGLFMLGLAAGGTLGKWQVSLIQAQLVAIGATLVTLVSWLVMNVTSLSSGLAAVIHGLLLLMMGTATGLVFPTASNALLTLGSDGRTAASWVESADHGGAAIAALVIVIVFVPVLGLVNAALLVLALQALAILLTLAAARPALRQKLAP
jgi:spermidine synthase